MLDFSLLTQAEKGSPYDNVDPYDVPDALNPEAPGDPSIFLNSETDSY
jgi:hypothetical protein